MMHCEKREEGSTHEVEDEKQPHRNNVQLANVKALNRVELLLSGWPGVPKSGMFRFSRSKMLCGFSFFAQIGTTHEYSVRRQICC